MKKKLAALLCGVLCVGSFTGCSSAELGVLKMSKEIVQTAHNCEISGQLQANIDLDALQGYAANIAELTGMPAVPGEDALSGKKAMTLDYQMQVDMDRMAYDMAFDVTYDGKSYDLGDMYYSLTDGIYYSTDGLMGIYDVAADLAEDAGQQSYFFGDAYAAELKAALGDGYVALLSAEDLTGTDMSSVVPKDGYSKLYDAAFTFYEDAMKGYETGLVKTISGGYAIEANGQAVAELLASLLDFVAENPDQVLDATQTYMTAVMDQLSMDQAAKDELNAALAEAKQSKEDFSAALKEISALTRLMAQDDSLKPLLDGFRYEGTVRKEGASYLSHAVFEIANGNQSVCSIVSDSTTKAASAKLTAPANAVALEDLTAKLAALEDKYNPINGVTINWGFEDTATEAMLSAARAEESVLDLDGADWTDLIVRDGRAYMPLRKICDMLGVDISWDKTARTAYVTVDGNRVDLAGILENGTSFVGVREFEKLGYTVDYSSLDGLKEAVIHK